MIGPQVLHMTEEEFEAWMEAQPEKTRAEFVDGTVYVMGQENLEHNDIAAFFMMLLKHWNEFHNLGARVQIVNIMVRLRPGLQRMPDVLMVTHDRESIVRHARIEAAPDLCLEVVSPDSVRRDWMEKLRDYEKNGVREYWIVDPIKKIAQVWSAHENGRFQVVAADGGVLRSRFLPGFFIRQAWLWQNPKPKIMPILRELGLLE